MKKRIIISISVFVGILFLSFLATSFIKWDLNPANWEQSERGITSALGLMIAVITVGCMQLSFID